jgi:hypothetical protein
VWEWCYHQPLHNGYFPKQQLVTIMYKFGSDRRRIPLSVILYRIIILLTVLLSVFLNLQLQGELPLNVLGADKTLGQAFEVPADPIARVSPQNGVIDVDVRTSCLRYYSRTAIRLCDALMGVTAPPVGGVQ